MIYLLFLFVKFIKKFVLDNKKNAAADLFLSLSFIIFNNIF